MNRRSFLAVGTSAASFGLTGCIGATDDRPRPRSGPDTRYPDDREVPTDASTHHLFVENFDRTDRVVGLAVARPEHDASVWRSTYEIPARVGFSVPDLLVEGRTYEIAVDVEDGGTATSERDIDPRPGEGGSRNVGVWLEDGDVAYRQDNCDEVLVGAKLSYADHERFVAD